MSSGAQSVRDARSDARIDAMIEKLRDVFDAQYDKSRWLMRRMVEMLKHHPEAATLCEKNAVGRLTNLMGLTLLTFAELRNDDFYHMTADVRKHFKRFESVLGKWEAQSSKFVAKATECLRDVLTTLDSEYHMSQRINTAARDMFNFDDPMVVLLTRIRARVHRLLNHVGILLYGPARCVAHTTGDLKKICELSSPVPMDQLARTLFAKACDGSSLDAQQGILRILRMLECASLVCWRVHQAQRTVSSRRQQPVFYDILSPAQFEFFTTMLNDESSSKLPEVVRTRMRGFLTRHALYTQNLDENGFVLSQNDDAVEQTYALLIPPDAIVKRAQVYTPR